MNTESQVEANFDLHYAALDIRSPRGVRILWVRACQTFSKVRELPRLVALLRRKPHRCAAQTGRPIDAILGT